MATGTPFIIQLAEALSALSVPLGGGLVTYSKWRKNAERDRRAREEAARIASEKAAADARKDEQSMRDRLLAEKDSAIARLEAQLALEKTENERLHRFIENGLQRNGGGNNGNRPHEQR